MNKVGKRILVLDAEPVVRSVISAILTREGYEVHATGNVNEALEIAKGSVPDLLLTNVHVPGMTGHEAAKLMRSQFPQLQVLMVAGLPDDERIRERTANDDHYDSFPKPFKASELAGKVRQMLEQGGSTL